MSPHNVSLSCLFSLLLSSVLSLLCVCAVWRVWCGTLKIPVCRFETPLCVHSKRLRVCRQQVHMSVHRGVFYGHRLRGGRERGRGGRGGRGGKSPPVLLTKKKKHSRRVLTCTRGSPPKKRKNLTHFQFENRSRTTCSRFLQTFAVPDKVVQLQLSCGKLRREPDVRWFGFSSAPKPKFHERFARQ